jgi:hypothetical protein
MPVAAVTEQRTIHPLPPSTEGSRRRALRRGLVAALAGGAIFVLVQGLLAAYNLHMDAIVRRAQQVSLGGCLGHCWREAIPQAILAYAGFALAGVVVASAGHRLLCALPASLFMLLGLPTACPGFNPSATGGRFNASIAVQGFGSATRWLVSSPILCWC